MVSILLHFETYLERHSQKSVWKIKSCANISFQVINIPKKIVLLLVNHFHNTCQSPVLQSSVPFLSAVYLFKDLTGGCKLWSSEAQITNQTDWECFFMLFMSQGNKQVHLKEFEYHKKREMKKVKIVYRWRRIFCSVNLWVDLLTASNCGYIKDIF